MLTEKTFKQNLSALLENFKEKEFLLAVSGGVDSMVLASLFKVLGLKFEVAHINYKLRGDDSDSDQKLIENFCKNHQMKFHLYEVSEKDKKPENSIQNWARNLRYDFFKNILKKENLDFLVTAHHLNDQLETFIINLSKASGIRGLSGIPKNENRILRPLLIFSKDEIYDFAKENKIEFREDLSNKKNDYVRNFIRNEIAPKLLETNENFLPNFAKSLEYLNQTKHFVEEKISEIEKEIILEKENTIIINKEKFFSQSDFVKFEILRKFGFENRNEIAKISEAEKGKIFQSNDFQMIVERNELVLVEKLEVGSWKLEDEILLEINDKNEINLANYIDEPETQNSKTVWIFDFDKISFPLKLRKKKDGDSFFPIGMIGKKKISKFFKDEKIPILAKQKIRILCDGNDNVLGVIPFRQDRRFSADEKTENTLKVFFLY